MSKSLKRVKAALADAGIATDVLEMAGETRTAADAAREAGCDIDGVAPIGHLTPPRVYYDPRLLEFKAVYAAAGTPRHIFPIDPADLLRVTGADQADFTT